MDLDNIQDDEILLGDATQEVVPPALITTAPVIDISFHPQLPIFAVGLVTGEVEVYEYCGNEIQKKPLVNDFSSWVFGREKMYSAEDVVITQHNNNMRMHPTGSVSAMEFTDDGSYLVTVSSDRTISVMDCVSARLVIHLGADQVTSGTAKSKKLNEMNKKNPDGVRTVKATSKRDELLGIKGKKKKTYTVTPNPHKYGISALNVCDDNLIATGDDDGLIALWDMRERKPVHTYHEHGDYVSQLCYFTDVQELVSSSGDTCLGCYDVRAGKIRDFSERRKEEINCFAFINSTGTNNRSFIPSIICGTPTGSLPLWKYGSWRRPYDTMESHPRECESIVSFHGENTTFNHNMVLTGACDGLVRVLQMYPVRRNICQISARDYTYSHQNAGLKSGGGGGSGNYIVRRGRGHESISKMRVSHDCNLLAVSGSDSIIDFVDISFLNDEAQLDNMRGKAERRHMETLRRMEREADARADAEERQRMEEEAMFASEQRAKANAKAAAEEKDADDDDSGKDDGSSSDSSDDDGDKNGDGDSSDEEGGSGHSSSGSEPTEEDRRQGMAIKERLIALLKRRAAEKRKEKLEKERLEALRREEESSSSDTDEKARGRDKSKNKDRKGKKARGRDYDSDSDADMFSSDEDEDDSDDDTAARKKRRLKDSDGGNGGGKKAKAVAAKKEQKPAPKAVATSAPAKKDGKKATAKDASIAHQEAAEQAMDAYREDRQTKRERVAAAKWLKEEKRRKVNFTYEKRRRRVGGFFGDMLGNE